MKNSQQLRWRFLLSILISAFSFQAWVQSTSTDSWDVMGDYTCVSPGSDLPAEKLFLLPDMSWDRVAPFTLVPFRLAWIEVQTRGWRGRLPYAFKPYGVFKVKSGIVELYNAELVEFPYVGHSPLLRGLLKQLDRPSALPAPPQPGVWATLLVQSFRFDRNSGQLTEVLPLDNPRLPITCDQRPLFAGDPSLSPLSLAALSLKKLSH